MRHLDAVTCGYGPVSLCLECCGCPVRWVRAKKGLHMANVFDSYQVTYLLHGGSDWDTEAYTSENASNAPQIGEGVVLSLDGEERAFRIVDVWTILPKRGGLEYGVYAFIEPVAFSRTPLPSWGQGYYRD